MNRLLFVGGAALLAPVVVDAFRSYGDIVQRDNPLVYVPLGELREFDGTRSFSLGPVPLNAPLSLEAWLHPAAPGQNDAGLVGTGMDAYQLTWHDNGQTPRVWFYVGGGGNAAPSGQVAVGAWHHVVGTWDGVTLRTYTDGRLTDERPSKVAQLAKWGELRLGEERSKFRGAIDHVAVYGYALSADQAARHYRKGAGVVR